MGRLMALAALVTTVVAAAPASARAETFVIGQYSYMVFDYEGDFFRFVGDDFAINDSGSYATFIPRTMDQMCSPCEPGDIVDPGFRTPREGVLLGEGTGTATVGGRTYTGLTYRGWLEVDAVPWAFPESEEFTVYARTSFTLIGFLQAFAGETEVFSGTLSGAGWAVAPYVPGDGGYVWEEGRLDYRFREPASNPVPEPVSLLLFGTGLAGAAASRMRRRARHRLS